MTPEPPSELAPRAERFALRPGRGAIALHATGFLHPSSRWRSSERFTAYGDLTHLQLGARTLRIATRQGVWILPRRLFADADAPAALVRALLERVAGLPGGAARLAGMAEVEAIFRRPERLRVASAAAALCVAVFGLGVALGPVVHHVGFMSPLLAAHGEPWRLVTANLLHAGAVHLAANVLGLLVLGALVERPLGAAPTLFVLGLSGVAANATAWLSGYDSVVGASGMVAGLAGAALWLEMRRPEQLPAAWRIPRRPFVFVLVLDALLPLVLPILAGAAHVGGFLAGATAAALAVGPRLRAGAPSRGLRVADALVMTIALVSLASAGRLLLVARAWEGHAQRLLAATRPPPLVLNDAAWLIATARAPSERALEDAVELAERAVRATLRRDPNVLDTLAEAQFRSGDARRAVATIEEAIALVPEEPYFREQRRRFLGERDAHDRPEPPGWPLPGPELAPEPPDFEEPGIPI